eukprot:s689_g40.t1
MFSMPCAGELWVEWILLFLSFWLPPPISGVWSVEPPEGSLHLALPMELEHMQIMLRKESRMVLSRLGILYHPLRIHRRTCSA